MCLLDKVNYKPEIRGSNAWENTIKLEASLVSIKPLPFLKIVTQAHL